ncbi:G2/mitotic-specific cyclin-4 [Monosporozyma unispora]|nr:hypothetical protein C6P44_003398 [Kazachstania unispora]
MMLQNSNRSKYCDHRSENYNRRATTSQAKNYLKPTNASMNRNRAALSDLTNRTKLSQDNANGKKLKNGSVFTQRQHKLNKIYTENKVNNFIDQTYLESGPSNVNNNTKENENVYSDDHTTTRDEETFMVEDDDAALSVEEEDDVFALDNEIVIEPLLPHYDKDIESILDEAVMKYFSPVPDPADEDTYDPVMALEYNIDIFTYMKELEIRYSPKPNYIDGQPQLKWHHRNELLDWLVKVHERFQLLPETLYLAINIMDRFLSKKIATLNRFQLVGITALYIACKYEEIHCPALNDILYILDNEYTREDILQAERFMINTLNFEISWPGPMSFLRRVSKADSYEYSIRTLSKYFLETTLLDPRLISSPPSWLAAGAYFLSRIILKDDQWSLKHVYYSGYTREQLLPLVLAICENCKDGESKHNSIWNKYSDLKYHQSREVFDQWVETMQT